MSPQKFCEQCGASLREETRFCESFGAPTGSEVNETAVEVPPVSSIPPSEPGPRVDAPQRGGEGSLKPVLMTLACIALVVIVGVAGWRFGFNPFKTAKISAPLPPGLVAMGDFTEGSPPGMEGDGRRLADGKNPSWQMQGPEAGMTWILPQPLAPYREEEKIRQSQSSCRIRDKKRRRRKFEPHRRDMSVWIRMPMQPFLKRVPVFQD